MEKLINDFSFGLFFWQTLLFIILLFLLKKYAWKPILDALNSREEGIRNALDEADKARQEMVELKSSNEQVVKEARAERDAMLKEAEKHEGEHDHRGQRRGQGASEQDHRAGKSDH